MALKHHPDKGGDAEHFKKVRHAYEVLTRYRRHSATCDVCSRLQTLSDPIKRKIYDRFGALVSRRVRRSLGNLELLTLIWKGRAAPTEHRKPTAGPTQFSLFNLFRRGAQRTTKASEPTGLPKSTRLPSSSTGSI